MTQAEKHIDEIKNMREEINWRVKISYTSNVVFLIVISFLSNFLSNPDYKSLDNSSLSLIGLTVAILISMYSSILNGNHLIEKRIELYILQLQKKLFEIDSFPHHFWISYLYGYRFKKHKTMRILSVISSTTVGIFQYAFPIFFSFFLIINMAIKFKAFYHHPFIFFIAIFSFVISFLSAVFFLIFVSKVSKDHSLFYNNQVYPYLNKQNEKN